MQVLRTVIFLVALSAWQCGSAQSPVRHFDPAGISDHYLNELRKEFGRHKQYPARYEKQILIALSYYPELKNTAIRFRVRHRRSIALTRSTWAGIFISSPKRRYVITISDSTVPALSPILFTRQPFDSQVGIIGHELGHVVQYSAMTTAGLIGYAASNISSRYVDHFEYSADATCIAHGLGYQLLKWSSYIREVMHTDNWLGPDHVHHPQREERYMNPGTIIRKINESPLYQRAKPSSTFLSPYYPISFSGY